MKMILYMTRGVSINEWKRIGLYNRELKLYRNLLKENIIKCLFIISYEKNIRNIYKIEKNIYVISVPYFLPFNKLTMYFYQFISPFFFKKIIYKADVIKSNQVDGSISVLFAKILNSKFKSYVRCGYLPSKFIASSKNKNTLEYLKLVYFFLYEKIVFNFSDISVVPTKEDHIYLGNSNKTIIQPNFYDEKNFYFNLTGNRINRFIFVGRLNKVKNIYNTIEAVCTMGYGLDVVGVGDELEDLILFVKKNNYDVNFIGAVDSSLLGDLLRKYKFYIQCSYWEGLPKTLIEAGACGCLRVGTNVNGINTVINDGVTGFLSEGTDVSAIKSAIDRSLASDFDNISSNTVSFIEKNFSLCNVINNEKEILLR